MSGQCYGCGAQFGIFKKEYGCKNCGSIFCGSCVNKKIAVPKYNNEKHKVCDRCYNILTGKIKPEKDKVRLSPPENYKKRIAALEDKNTTKSHTSQTKGAATNKSRSHGMSQKDKEIAARLEKLKEDRRKEMPPVPSFEEMQDRLARLKGEEPRSTQANPSAKFYHPPDRRTEQEQVNSLLDEIHDEAQIDSHWLSPEQDISNRLAHLKGEANKDKQDTLQNNLNKSTDVHTGYTKNIGVIPDPNADPGHVNPVDVHRLICEVAEELKVDEATALAGLQKDNALWERLCRLKSDKLDKEQIANTDPQTPDSDEENEDEAAKKIIKMALEEQKLDEAAGLNNTKNLEKQGFDPDELPWCCICNSDAVLRCQGCDNDLYCKRCFREGHDHIERHEHITVPYKPPNPT